LDTVKDLEWLQFSRFVDNLIVTLDSNRNTITFIDTQAQKRMSVKYRENWALQEFIFLAETSEHFLEIMKEWFRP
jgi:hypothetical protein